MRFLTFLLSFMFSATLAWANPNKSAFSDLQAESLGGKVVPFKTYEGQVVLVVNTASKCGFTPQFGSLQKLYDTYKDKGFVVLGFPSDDFKQEDLDGQAIAKFCELNYGVKFPIFKKTNVNGPSRHPVYTFLTTKAAKTGDVQWNFEKFLVNRRGEVIGRFSSSVEPSAVELTKAIETALADSKKS